jgi:hypothetical protein
MFYSSCSTFYAHSSHQFQVHRQLAASGYTATSFAHIRKSQNGLHQVIVS